MRRIAIATIWISLISGCATGSKDTILPQDGPSMKEVYDAHFERTRQRFRHARIDMGQRDAGDGTSNLESYTREANSEIEAVFPRLPNPGLVMYVFPHLSAKGNPIPGYATSFPLYETVEYALPGESEGRQ